LEIVRSKIDVEGLSITITSTAADSTDDTSKSKVKGKSKAKASGKELISDAHLRLKGGVHYGLLGRNGTGKSSKRQWCECFWSFR
jgi:ABC-type polysaccharide/polyol phosphate transport system ATPase subunit